MPEPTLPPISAAPSLNPALNPGAATLNRGATSPHVVTAHAVHRETLASFHERQTHAHLAQKLAALKGGEFAGEHEPMRRYDRPVYFIPADTIAGAETARALGIADEHDLFGGVVPHPFVATKAISHALIDPGADAPEGWSHEFGNRVRDVVLRGLSAFTLADAREAGARLLEAGPVRLKAVREAGGRGQSVIHTLAELDAALAALDEAEVSEGGLVLEEDLSDPVTYSVGQVRVGDLIATYCGTQTLTTDHQGGKAFGGSNLVVARGGFEELLALNLEDRSRLAVEQARVYDAAANECFSPFFASRRNYDIAQGMDSTGRWRSGVLEQSWRIGGASSAEVAALEAFAADPELVVIRASCREIYGDSPVPERATVSFCGIDEKVGLITKYTLVEQYDAIPEYRDNRR